jgi:hypothetical protein
VDALHTYLEPKGRGCVAYPLRAKWPWMRTKCLKRPERHETSPTPPVFAEAQALPRVSAEDFAFSEGRTAATPVPTALHMQRMQDTTKGLVTAILAGTKHDYLRHRCQHRKPDPLCKQPAVQFLLPPQQQQRSPTPRSFAEAQALPRMPAGARQGKEEHAYATEQKQPAQRDLSPSQRQQRRSPTPPVFAEAQALPRVPAGKGHKVEQARHAALRN